jgi:hypothetical protein
MFPDELPEALAEKATPIEVDGEGFMTWSDSAALEVIEALRHTKVAILEIFVFYMESFGPVPSTDGWDCTPSLGETATDFAERSMNGAREFIETHERTGETLYSLVFSTQDDAA